MTLQKLPNEEGEPLAEFDRADGRYRLTLREYHGRPIFRLERWIQAGEGQLWTYRAGDGLSLLPRQAMCLFEGLQSGLRKPGVLEPEEGKGES